MNISNLRPELTSHLFQRIHSFQEGFRQNLAIIGPPGSGKTFQLQQLAEHKPGALGLIYCPLYRESCRSLLSRFASTILQAAMQSQENQSANLDILLQRAEEVVPRMAIAGRMISELLTRRVYGEAFTRTLDLIPILIEERRQPCVLILDEFLLLEDLGLAHAFHEIGKRVMIWQSVLFILASSSPYRARMILRERLHLLFGQFELMSLDEVGSENATAWLNRELRGLKGARSISPFLVSWLGRYPWYLLALLKRIRELATLKQTVEVNAEVVIQALWDLLGSAEGTLHHWCASRIQGLNHLRGGTRAVEALLQVAERSRSATEIGKRIGRADLSGALQLLVEQDLIERIGACWRVEDPILRCWLSSVLARERSVSHVQSSESRLDIERYLQVLWSRWIQKEQLSLSQQMSELFSKFNDDTISLDSKTGRLPRFNSLTLQPAASSGMSHYLVAEGEGKRWCVGVHEGLIDENAVANFEAFCKTQMPKPTRKVVITKEGLEQNARLLAKTTNMWVWGAKELSVLMDLYGQT